MTPKHVEAVRRACAALGNQAALARALGVTPVTVGQWLKPDARTGRQVPPKQCVRIEHLTQGRVSRRELRPDDYAEIWPELAAGEESKHKPTPCDHLELVDRRERAVPIDFPDRRRPSGDGARKAA